MQHISSFLADSLKVDNTGQLLHNCRVTIVVIVIDDLVVIDDSRKLATP